MLIRERTEQMELLFLSDFAVKSVNTKGRKNNEELCEIRTEFQRDRDRILHCKSFRRLKHKTQVFISPEGDHYRTRLTHTLEVAQIARTIARALNLNEDLTEAIALGHDLGHTPFGHTGEYVLDKICPNGFKHSLQSVKVVEVLEKQGKGLNLTFEVIDGIKNHTGEDMPCTLEGQIVKYADKIAYINHDIDDAIRANIITLEDIDEDILAVIGRAHGQRINCMIKDIIENSLQTKTIKMSTPIHDMMISLRKFMFEKVYVGSLAKKEEEKGKRLIELLFEYFQKHLDELPKEYKFLTTIQSVDETICDYIAGMSDRYALFIFNELFVPKSWNIK